MTQEVTPHAPADEPSQAGAAVAVTDLRFEHLRDALGIGAARPRLSWLVETERPDWLQAAYEIEAAGAGWAGARPHRPGRSDQSVLVAWPFAPLASRERVSRAGARVGQRWQRFRLERAVSGRGRAACSPTTGRRGLSRPDWDEDTSRPQPAPLLRREFSVAAGVAQARLYVTALGVYEAQINGAPVGDHVLDPGWTSYNHRLRYQTFDVTAAAARRAQRHRRHAGRWLVSRPAGLRRRAAATSMATGWRCWPNWRSRYADGTTERIVTDEQLARGHGPDPGQRHLRRRDL